ncbi:MAG: aminotransferase class V-fold PLP-dependent enzyme, partial [Firmicutes bacterium]|nr:aminotransferase class V-fold PLP-dependent enzyme [Bacillota bacterium]
LGIKGETLVHALEEYGIYISTGAACSSKKTSKSHVLDVMGCSPERIESSVRFSFSILNTMDEVRFCVDKLIEVVKELRSIIRR